VPVVPVLSWGPHLIFDPRDGHRKLRFRRTPVTLAAGPPVDLDTWVGAEPTAANLQAITGEIMGTLRDMMAQIRGEQPPAEEPAEPPVLPPDQPARPAGRRRGPEADR
jgi:1-acyl-sn-glycerol-3-phosphate acyltransferase